jgi:glycolate oxidase iron-sulfur subunit
MTATRAPFGIEQQSPGLRSQLAELLDANREGLLTCIHCGLCLPACPTYLALGNENESPRGRIYLMRALVENRIDMSPAFTSHIDLCLGCRACETACPSAVPYGQLLEASRAGIALAEEKKGSATALVTRFVLGKVFTRPRLLGAALRVTRWVRDSGLARLAFQTGLFSGRLQLALALLVASRPASPSFRTAGKRSVTSLSQSPPANPAAKLDSGVKPLAGATAAPKAPAGVETAFLKVATLTGCVMEGLFAPANRATERVLEAVGCHITSAPNQVCCGALHAHAGQLETAKSLARRNIDAFEATGCERVIVNAAGCGAAMKEYHLLLAEDPQYRDRASRFSSIVRDITEFLREIEVPVPYGDLGSRIDRRVTYDAPCHLVHAQRVKAAPQEILAAIPGIELVPLRGSETCCGGAGIYNLLNPELSSEILAKKLDDIVASRAEVVATGNPGCIMQIGAGLLMRGLEIDVVHPIELVDAAYSGKPR